MLGRLELVQERAASPERVLRDARDAVEPDRPVLLDALREGEERTGSETDELRTIDEMQGK